MTSSCEGEASVITSTSVTLVSGEKNSIHPHGTGENLTTILTTIRVDFSCLLFAAIVKSPVLQVLCLIPFIHILLM